MTAVGVRILGERANFDPASARAGSKKVTESAAPATTRTS